MNAYIESELTSLRSAEMWLTAAKPESEPGNKKAKRNRHFLICWAFLESMNLATGLA